MAKGQNNPKNCSRDVREGMKIAENMKEVKQQLKDDADRRKIDGFNPGDLRR